MTVTYILLGTATALLIAILAVILRKKPEFSAEELLARLKDGMEAASFKTLSEQSKLGEQVLDSKKQLIDSTVEQMRSELERIKLSLSEFDKNAKANFQTVAQQLKTSAETAGRLNETTGQLKEVLKSSKARGQWGERMAEDVLTMAGMTDNINYVKQKQTGTGTKPDFTFLLPQGLKANMDVKFPFDNYLAFAGAASDIEREAFRKKFLSDVREKIKQVTTRDYIDQSAGTVDYVILFIPNEQVYAFINESDNTLMDEALRKKVIMCSPLTLYAVLAVIRQAHENFRMEKAAREVNAAFANFEKQWNMYTSSFDKMGAKLKEAQAEYDILLSTRKTQLERTIAQLNTLRSQAAEGETEDTLLK